MPRALGLVPALLFGLSITAFTAYGVNSTLKGYTIKATLGPQTYVIDENGVESGRYRTN